MTAEKAHPSLEALVERGDIELEVLHPGGLAITGELARLCRIGKGSRVLDVASGTGESACFLATEFDAEVLGIDLSEAMADRARQKAAERRLAVSFRQGNALALPVADNSFDAAISECTTCLLDKDRALAEMVRVVRPGGFVGIHDVCWRPGAPEKMKDRLAGIEGERPETLEGWKALFEKAGLSGVVAVDKSDLMQEWMKEIRKDLGLAQLARIFLRVLGTWGLQGLWDTLASERIFRSRHVGYGIIVGKKPEGNIQA